MEAGGWLFKISRGLCHLEIPDAAVNAVGHLNIQVGKKTSGFIRTLPFVGMFCAYNHGPVVLRELPNYLDLYYHPGLHAMGAENPVLCFSTRMHLACI